MIRTEAIKFPVAHRSERSRHIGALHPQKQHPQDLQSLRDRVGRRRVARLEVTEALGRNGHEDGQREAADKSARTTRDPIVGSTHRRFASAMKKANLS
jgi:hypothetical protein